MVVAEGGAGGGNEPTFSQLATQGEALIAEHEFTEMTAVDQMPAGSAMYRGVGAYSNDPDTLLTDPTSVSQVEVAANFDSGSLSGRAYNFQSNPALGIDIDGELAI